MDGNERIIVLSMYTCRVALFIVLGRAAYFKNGDESKTNVGNYILPYAFLVVNTFSTFCCENFYSCV